MFFSASAVFRSQCILGISHYTEVDELEALIATQDLLAFDNIEHEENDLNLSNIWLLFRYC